MTKPEVNSGFGLRLCMVRETLSMTQAALAERAGLTPSGVSHFEQGRRLPSSANLVRLCEALHVSADWLLGIDKSKLPGRKPSGPASKWTPATGMSKALVATLASIEAKLDTIINKGKPRPVTTCPKKTCEVCESREAEFGGLCPDCESVEFGDMPVASMSEKLRLAMKSHDCFVPNPRKGLGVRGASRDCKGDGWKQCVLCGRHTTGYRPGGG